MSYRNKGMLLSFLFLTPTVYAIDDPEFEAFLNQTQSEFSQFEQQRQKEFQAFVDEWHKAEAAYKKQLKQKWQQPELPSKKVWVSYSQDLNQRTKVDYDQGIVHVEFSKKSTVNNVVEKAKSTVKKLSLITPKQAISEDPIVKQVAIKLDKTVQTRLQSITVKQKTSAEELQKVTPQLSNTQLEVTPIVKPEIVEKVIKKQPVITENQDLVRVSFTLPKTSLMKKAQPYLEQVTAQSERWNVKPELLLAVIHTESSFNPMARSPIPAFGLMQIVPSTAGRDVSALIHGKSLLYSPEYLYQASNNIEAGSAYLHLLQNRYFKHVRDPETKSYLSIAAYNTGIGNVALTLTGTKSLQQAAVKANLMSPAEVHQKLLRDLPAQETRNYLKKVLNRSQNYAQQLKGIKL